MTFFLPLLNLLNLLRNPPSFLRLDHPSLIRLRHDALLISLDIPRKRLHAPPITHPQTRAHILQHGHVMTNHQHATLERPQRARQSIHGLNVKMIGRFVQNEDMRVRQTQTRKRNAGLLTAGQEGHFLQPRRARNAKGAEVPSVLLVLLARVILRHESDGADGHVEGVDVVLGEEADAEAGVLGDEAGRGLEVADEEFEDGGLAGAVGADDADARVELHVQVDVAEERSLGRVAEGDARHLDDGRGELLHLGEFEVHRVLAFRGFQDGHLFEFLDARLGFGGFGGVVAKLVDEGLQVGALGHLVLVLAFGRLAALFFGGVEGVEVGAFVVVEAFGVLVDYVGGHFV